MHKIQKGRARNFGPKFAQIRTLDTDAMMTSFRIERFTIVPETPVYFIDFDVDPILCDNVQSIEDVESFVGQAVPGGGSIAADAGPELRNYLMAVLLISLSKKGVARENYRAGLSDKMVEIAVAAAADGGPVTVALLKALGIIQ